MKQITEEMVAEAMRHGWTEKDAKRGYAVFVSDYGNGAEHIEKIDEMDVFADDAEAAEQAEKDGIKIIRDMKFIGEDYGLYLDTPENRELLKDLCVL